MAEPDAPPAAATILWHSSGRPSAGHELMVALVAVFLVIGGAVFGAMIHLEREPWYGLGVGVIMALLFTAGMAKGVSVRLDQQGLLTLAVSGKDNLQFPITLINDSTMVHAGLLRGVGVRLDDWQRIRFLHKSGISYSSMKRLRRRLGVDLVFEHLTAADQQDLIQWREHFRTKGADEAALAEE